MHIGSDHPDTDTASPPPIAARIWSDDHVSQASFDATPWFASANDRDIVELAATGWGGDQIADAVALACVDLAPDVAHTFAYLNAVNQTARDTIGFECDVDSDDAIAWLAIRRPRLHALLAAAIEADDGLDALLDGITPGSRLDPVVPDERTAPDGEAIVGALCLAVVTQRADGTVELFDGGPQPRPLPGDSAIRRVDQRGQVWEGTRAVDPARLRRQLDALLDLVAASIAPTAPATDAAPPAGPKRT